MIRRLRLAAFWSYWCVTVVTANRAAEDTPHNHVNKRGGGNAQGGATHLLSTPTWTVPATGSGSSYAQACNSESAVYDNLLSYGVTPTGDGFATVWVTTTSYTAETTRLCDGRERVLGSLTPVNVGSVLSQVVPTITYTGPAPSCSLLPSDCYWLRTSYLSAQSSYTSSLSKNPNGPPGDSPTVPRCYISGPPLDVCGQCTIHGDHVELLYFPVTTPVSRDMCATTPTSQVICPYGPTYSNNDTKYGFATAPCPYINTEIPSTTDSGPKTVINGTTFYSNRAYISYNTLYATNSCGRVGGTYSNGLVAVASSDVYSLSGYHFYMTHAAYSFNFADLIPPVPASAYLCQATCDNSGSPLSDGDMLNGKYGGALGFCSTIIDEAFKPWIAVPPQIRALDPQFQDCLLGLDALFDPPRLMVSEATLDIPSATTTPDAEPQQGASTAHTTPAPTAASDMLPEPSQESPDSHSAATNPASDQHAGNPMSPAAATEPQTTGLPEGTQNDASSDFAGSPMLNDAGSDASPNTASSTTANDAGSNDASNTGNELSENVATTSRSPTAMMESQTSELVQGSQGDGPSTIASGSLANDASTNKQSDRASASDSPSSTSAGVSLVSKVWRHAAFALFLVLSYII